MLFGILSGAESPEYDDTAGFRVAVCHCFHSDPNKTLYVAKYTKWYIMQSLNGLLMITSTIQVEFLLPIGGWWILHKAFVLLVHLFYWQTFLILVNMFFRILLNVKLFPILLRVHQSHWEGDSISGIGKLFIKKRATAHSVLSTFVFRKCIFIQVYFQIKGIKKSFE